jgi:arylsulfatase A-like enzyme
MSDVRNVLLVVVDQWRGDYLPNLGADFLRLPNIERLCAEGVTFRNHYTQAAPCGPARASLLTGLYMMNHRAVQNTIPLDPRHDHMGRMLLRAGYEPALIGYTSTTPDPRTTSAKDPRFRVMSDMIDSFRVLCRFEPDEDEYFGWLLEQGYTLPPDAWDIWRPRDGEPGATASPSRVPAELSDTRWFTNHALSYLRRRTKRPWFLHLGYYRPHPPFIAPEPYNAMYDPAAMRAPLRAASPEAESRQHPLLAHYLREIRQRSFFQGAPGFASEMTADQVAQLRATYCGLMSEIDAELGRVLDFLRDSGQLDDTLIIFTCDHGEQLGDHHLLGKVGYFDESFRIPLIIRDPRAEANVTRGSIVERFTETIDTLPTMLDWIGADIPRAVDGRSLLPFVDGRTPADWRDAAHYEFDFRDIYYSQAETGTGVPMDKANLAVIRDEHYKYVHFAGLPPLFFDLRQDPGQFVDRAADPAYASLVRDYAQRMLDWRLSFAERTLTGFRATPQGLEARA